MDSSTPAIMAINCPTVKQHIAKGLNYHDFMLKDAKTLLAEHLRALMEAHPRLKDRPSIAQATGMAPRTVGNLLNPGSGNPTLKHIVAVAEAFGVRPWQLLIDVELEKVKFLETMVVPHVATKRPPPDDPPMALHQSRRPYKN